MRVVRFSAAAVMAAAVLGAAATGAVAKKSGPFPVTAGPAYKLSYRHLDLDGFYPAATRVHVGESISFAINGFHTVSFLAPGQESPPLIVPNLASPVSGKLDAAKSAFWFNGKPNLIMNPAVQLPAGGNEVDGTKYVNSGLPNPTAPPAPFVVKFTKEGTYSFFCLVHPGMKGSVTVVGAGKPVQTLGQQKARARAQTSKAVAEALGLARIQPGARTVLAGHDGAGAVAWLRFFPETLKIKVGTTVNFKLGTTKEPHTITFGPAAYREEIEKSFTTPVIEGGPPPKLLVNPVAAYPSDPPPLPPLTGTNHGNGFLNAGILQAAGPNPSSVQITFTKPGTFKYECEIHAGMDGKIVVTK